MHVQKQQMFGELTLGCFCAADQKAWTAQNGTREMMPLFQAWTASCATSGKYAIGMPESIALRHQTGHEQAIRKTDSSLNWASP
jgi:hypothetical protein